VGQREGSPNKKPWSKGKKVTAGVSQSGKARSKHVAWEKIRSDAASPQ